MKAQGLGLGVGGLAIGRNVCECVPAALCLTLATQHNVHADSVRILVCGMRVYVYVYCMQ